MAGLDFTLFGGFAVSHDGERLPPIPSRVSRALLAHLVLARGQGVARDRIVATFWPDMPESRGRRRLSHTLWQVQDALGDLPTEHRFIEAHGDLLAFNVETPHTVDVDEFERRLEPFRPPRASGHGAPDLRRLESALELYQGPLLEGIDDPWVEPERIRLATLHVDALGWMVELARERGAYELALVHARRLTHHDPLREDAHREVMRLCTLLGRTSEALRQYERCRSVLAEELGTEPARATQQLAEFVARQRGAPVAAPPSPGAPDPRNDLRLVGRDRERAALVEGLERTLAGGGGLSLVEGEAGAGKTRLVQQLADDAAWRGFSIAFGRCEADAGLPYLAVAEAVAPLLTPVRIAQLRPRVGDAWLAEVGRLVPRLARTDLPPTGSAPGDAADRMREAFVRLLTGLAELEPTLLVLEDLHEADPETLQVVDWLAGRLSTCRLHAVLTFRGAEARARERVWATLRTVDAATVPARVALEPLTRFGTTELVRDLLGAGAPTELAGRVHAETGGNPLFVVETLRLLAEHDAPAADGALPLPRSIRDVTSERLAMLPPTVREVLDAAAVQARAVDLDTLTDVVAATAQPGLVGDAVAELLRRGLLVEHDAGYAFTYDQVRRVVVDALDPQARAALHGRVADALAHHHPDRVEDLARHLDAAGRVTEAVVAWRAAADRAVAVHAPGTARDHLARAVELQRSRPVSVDRRADLLAAYEDVLSVLAARDTQAAVLDELAELVGPSGSAAADVARRRAWLAAHTDDYARAESEAHRAVELAEDVADRAAALTVLGTARAWRGHHDDAVAALEQALAVGPRPDDAVRARVALGSALRSLARFAEAVRVLEDAAVVCAEDHDAHGEARVLSALAVVRMEQGDLAEAIDGYELALASCRQLGYRHGEGVNLVNLANARYVAGQVLEALAGYDEAAEVFASIGNPRGRATVQMNAALLRHEVLGDDAGAEEHAHRALAWFASAGDGRAIATCHLLLAGVRLRDGRMDDARAQLELATAAAGTDAVARVDVGRVAADLALAAGDAAGAVERLTAAVAAARDAGVDAAEGRLRANRAIARLEIGDLDGAEDDARAAETALAAAGEQAPLAHWARHRVALARGAPDVAARALERAEAAVEALLAGLPDDARDRSCRVVPAHAAIREAAAASAPRRVAVRVADADAPTGRPLDDHELREVVVELPAETDDGPTARRRVLADVVAQVRAQGGAPTVDDLAEVLDVSPSTVRRDMTALRRSGTVVETRGARGG